MKSWKCEVGDLVEFYFSEWAKLQEKIPLKGTITARTSKVATIKIEGSALQVNTHVNLISIIKPVPRVKLLARKFGEKPTNGKKLTSSKEVVREVGGMTFKYKKKQS